MKSKKYKFSPPIAIHQPNPRIRSVEPQALRFYVPAILIRELGPVDYARFIQQYEEGSGNYTADRHQWLGEECAETLHAQASQLASNGELPRPTGAKLLGTTD